MIKQFYKEYVFPVSPTPNYRPVVDVIIAARRHTKSMTWMARGNRLRKVKEFAAFGSGEAYARALFSGLDLAMSNEVAMCVAAYIIFLIKKRNMSVGLDTQVICIDRENWYVREVLIQKSAASWRKSSGSVLELRLGCYIGSWAARSVFAIKSECMKTLNSCGMSFCA